MWDKVFPTGYQATKAIGGKKIKGWIAIACLIGCFGLIPILFNPNANLGLVLIIYFIFLFFLWIISIAGKLSGIGKKYLNDIVDWPSYIHNIIISFTFILAVLIGYIYYGKSREPNK